MLTDRQIWFEWIDLRDLNQNLQISYNVGDTIGFRLVTSTGKVVESQDILSVWWRRALQLNDLDIATAKAIETAIEIAARNAKSAYAD